MKPPQRTEAERIAGTLTKAQRREVIRGSIGDAPMPLVRRLIAMGLMHVVPNSPNGRWGPCQNTDLGNQVKALLSQDQTDER